MTALATIDHPKPATPRPSFRDAMTMGQALVGTGFLPDHIKNGAQAAAIMIAGSELGMDPMRALRSLMFVKGKIVESADSQLARFKTDGGRAQFAELTETAATLHLVHPNGDKHTESFTLEDAKRAGLLSSGMYNKFPKAMLRSRVITAGLKSIGWEGGSGVYDPSELQVEHATAAAPVNDSAEYVHAETIEPRQLAAPRGPLTLDSASALTVKGKTLGEMSDKQLEKVRTWAQGAGNDRLAEGCDIVLASRQDDADTAILSDREDAA